MLVNQHAYGVYGYLAPILHLRRVDSCDLFDMYVQSLERIWQESYPFKPTVPEVLQRASLEAEQARHQTISVAQVGQNEIRATI